MSTIAAPVATPTVAGTLVFDGEVEVPADVFDLDGFRRWVHSPEFPERASASYLDGQVVVDMSPEEIQSHNKVKSDVHGGMWVWARDWDLGDLLSDGALLVNKAANLSTEPDIVFCSWDGLRTGRVRYSEYVKGSGRQVEVVGSPDLVVEIVSLSSVGKDKKRLPKLYFAAGVLEYWLIDARGVELQFTLYRRAKKQFSAVKPDAKGYRRSDVLDGSFRIDRERDRVGGWRYTLVSKT